MPRAFNAAACNTCRQRKVKCDEKLPICGQCSRNNRYCDRSKRRLKGRSLTSTPKARSRRGITADAPLAYIHPPVGSLDSALQTPREALKQPAIARYFRHFITEPATWYDLSDPARLFCTRVPELALDEPLLFCALIALSAIHVSKTNVKAAATVAERWHERCIHLLIGLDENSHLLENGVALAATCLLRSYEILEGDVDPNRHLQGAYSFASRILGVSAGLNEQLMAAGFWNYLREDITFSLYESCALKSDLRMIDAPDVSSDEYQLNGISLILGRVINLVFGAADAPETSSLLLESALAWYESLPERFQPFARTSWCDDPGTPLPSVWFLRDCHASCRQYYLITLCLLAVDCSDEQLSSFPIFSTQLGLDSQAKHHLLNHYALEVCGIGFTSKNTAILVNSFGPIAHCGKYLLEEASREEVVRCLATCKKTIGWPIDRLVTVLRTSWRGTSASNQY